MTTSGVSTYNENLNQLVYASARKLGFVSFGETLSAAVFQAFTDQLNVMVKALNSTGLHIWTEEEAILFTQPSQYSYVLGGTTTDNCAWTTYSQTTLVAGAASGSSSISVANSAGFGTNYNVGVVLDSGVVSWSLGTPSHISPPAGTTVTLTPGLTGTASAGNNVFVYQTKIERPLRVVSGRRFAFSGSLDTQMIMMSRIDYRNQPNKTNPGVITQFFYDPRGGANNQGVMWLWPAPADASSAFKFTWWRQIQDFSAQSNTPDLPQEWLDFLIWGLAEKMWSESGANPQVLQYIQQQASAAFDVVSSFDREPESYLFGVDMDQTGP